MKSIITIVSALVFALTTTTSLSAAGAATFTMTFRYASGAPAVGQQVSCTATGPKTSAYPPKPIYTYLTADGSGVSVWNINVVDGTSYNCMARTALTPDNCYTWGSATTGTKLLTGGENLTFLFTAGATSGCTSSTTPSPASPQPTSSPTPASQPIVKPTLTDIKLTPERESKAFTSDEVITMSGKTSPGATITLTVHSDVQEFQTKADADGKWTYTLPKLKPGEHYVDAVAVDTSGAKSEPQTVARFTVSAKPAASSSKEDASASRTSGPNVESWQFVAAGLVILVVAGTVVYLIIRRKQRHLSPSHATESTPAPSSDTEVTSTSNDETEAH